MNEQTQRDISEHAIAEFPRECCGLVAIIKGKERYLPCRNIAESQYENFVLHPEDYSKAEDLGEVVALVHSHPNGSVRMSEADRVMCNQSGLPWVVVQVSGDPPLVQQMKRYEPDGYVAPLVGRQFSHGVLDCYALIRDYYQRELGIELPDFDRRDNWWNKGDNLYMDHFRDAGFDPIKGDLQVGDVIIMQVRAPVPNHAAIYLGNGQMLHHMYGRLSTREIYGGYYQEITRVIVRHKSLSQ